MIKKIGLLLAGVMGLYALEACVVVDCGADPTNAACANSGGNGGSAGAGVSSSSGSAGTGGTGGAGGTGGGAPACAKTCADAITDMVPVCDTSPGSLALFEALSKCTCERASTDADPGCNDVDDPNTPAPMDESLCGGPNNICTMGPPSANCSKCLQTLGCMDELGACSGDT